MPTMKELLDTLPQTGKVDWIGVRPGRRQAMRSMDSVHVSTESGIEGDHYSGGSKSRQITLIQTEHLAAVTAYLGVDYIDPAAVRRNIVVSGINIHALKDSVFAVGDVELETTGLCHPCSRMEEVLGPGGYNAMRSHGGINARVLTGGEISVGGEVRLLRRV